MSVVQTDKVDFISLREGANLVVLTISDHLDWIDTDFHLERLQDKLNSYLSFIESGEIYDVYPKALGKSIVIEVIGKYPLNEEAEEFYEYAKKIIKEAGFELRFTLLEEE